MNQFVMATPFGRLEFVTNTKSLVRVNLNVNKELSSPSTALELNIYRQVDAYLKGELTQFSIPLGATMSPFQSKVCQALLNIPLGETVTYGVMAKRLSSSARAIGGGCRRNPLPVVIPCHRVTAAHGIGGFAGQISGGLIDSKRWLLAHEQKMVANGYC